MWVWLFILLFSVGAGTYLASVGCRVMCSRHRRPAWIIAILATIGAAALTVLCLYQTDLFRPLQWAKGKGPMWVMVAVLFTLSSGAALLPALGTVWYYRDSSDDGNHQA